MCGPLFYLSACGQKNPVITPVVVKQFGGYLGGHTSKGAIQSCVPYVFLECISNSMHEP